MIRIVSSVFMAIVLAFCLGVCAAQAQSRVFVAAQGSDSNACTFAAPCRTFQHAHDVVTSGGEIDVLDPAGYGALTISKSISIQGHGFSGLTVASGGTGITIATGVSVHLSGLLIDGAGSGLTGIDVSGNTSLQIANSVIRNLSGNGVLFEPSFGSLAVSDTYVAATGGTGILVRPVGNGVVSAEFERVQAYGTIGSGIAVLGTLSTGTVKASAANSVVSNSVSGFFVQSSTNHAATSLMLVRCRADNNSAVGLTADGQNATLRMTSTAATSNATGWVASNGGTVSSYGDNAIDGNGSDGGTPPLISKK